LKRELISGEIDRIPGSHGFVGGEHDRQARKTVLQVRGQVNLLANRPDEILLFAPAKLVVIGLIRLPEPFVRAGKASSVGSKVIAASKSIPPPLAAPG
jgi:hypothetical protein